MMRTEADRWSEHIAMERHFYDPDTERGSGETKGPSRTSIRKTMGYVKRAPRCENCVRFEWLPNGGGPNCTLARFHASPMGLCNHWLAAKGQAKRHGCSLCSGTGTAFLPDPWGGVTGTCPDCHGTGKAPASS